MPTTTTNSVKSVEVTFESCCGVTTPLALSCCSLVVALVIPVSW